MVLARPLPKCKSHPNASPLKCRCGPRKQPWGYSGGGPGLCAFWEGARPAPAWAWQCLSRSISLSGVAGRKAWKAGPGGQGLGPVCPEQAPMQQPAPSTTVSTGLCGGKGGGSWQPLLCRRAGGPTPEWPWGKGLSEPPRHLLQELVNCVSGSPISKIPFPGISKGI